MGIQIIVYCILLLTFIYIGAMLYKLYYTPTIQLSWVETGQLIFSGIVAFIADTIGVGSFAVNIACAKLFNTFHDEELPPMSNAAQVIPGMFESLFFIQLTQIDLKILIPLVIATCIGGVIGSNIISRLSKQAIRLAMMTCFTIIIILLSAEFLQLIPTGGQLTSLSGNRMILAFFAMMICGSLTSAGIGLFSMVQAALFLLNVSPSIAFPIMTTSGAMQQPLTALIFLQKNKIPLKKTLILSVSGCIGVLIALPIITHMSTALLHALLLLIITYNLYRIAQDYLKSVQIKNNSLKNTCIKNL